jgi:hypothetical protein
MVSAAKSEGTAARVACVLYHQPRRCDAMGQLPEGAAQTSDKTERPILRLVNPAKKALLYLHSVIIDDG